MERREEKHLEHLWSIFCGKENSQEEHYFVDEDNLKMYMKLTDIYTDELISWEEITNPETIISVYGVYETSENDMPDNSYEYPDNHWTNTERGN